LTLFSSIFTPQGKYLYEFFILKFEDGYLLECEKKTILEIIKLFNFYKLRAKVNLIDASKKYNNIIISLEKFKEITKSQHVEGSTLSCEKGSTLSCENERIYVDPRHKDLGAKIITKIENNENIIKKLDLKKIDKKKYYEKSFTLGIPQIDLNKFKEKIFGIENNLDELNGIDFKKGCYVGQENTSRIKLRNKLRRRILPIQKISGEIYENDVIKYKDHEIGKIMIDKPYSFALIKVVDPDLKEFTNVELICGNSKVKILKPEWI
jgi:folate-binding protein YgfZ